MRHIILRTLSFILLGLCVPTGLVFLWNVLEKEFDFLHLIGLGAMLYYLSGILIALWHYTLKGPRYKPKNKLVASFFEPFGGSEATIYIRLWRDRLKANCKELNSSFDEKPIINQDGIEGGVNPFNHSRVLLSDIPLTELYLREVIKHLLVNDNSNRKINIVFHPMECLESGLSQSEISSYFILAERLEASAVMVYKGTSPKLSELSFDQMLDSEDENFIGMVLKY